MEVSDWIASAARERAVQGSELAQRLRARFPGWTPQAAGARNLRDFVDRFVDGVGVIGHSGMDVVYGTSDLAVDAVRPDAHPSPDSAETNFWRVWVSPNSPYALLIDLESGQVTQVPRPESQTGSGEVLQPASSEVHEEIAKEFASKFPTEAQRSAIIGGNPGWWREWQAGLKAEGLEAAWLEYRTSRLESTLRERLRDMVVEPAVLEKVFAGIVKGRGARPRVVGTKRTPQSTERQELESVLLAVIPRMDVGDLRELKVPVGLLLDALSQHRST